jgi:hypothetical protein
MQPLLLATGRKAQKAKGKGKRQRQKAKAKGNAKAKGKQLMPAAHKQGRQKATQRQKLSEVSLAYWIMDDGSFTGSGLKLHTNAFSLEELNLLIKALDKNFSTFAFGYLCFWLLLLLLLAGLIRPACCLLLAACTVLLAGLYARPAQHSKGKSSKQLAARQQGAGSRQQGAWSMEHGAWSMEQGAGSRLGYI